jgi:hypothetical protein
MAKSAAEPAQRERVSCPSQSFFVEMEEMHRLRDQAVAGHQYYGF